MTVAYFDTSALVRYVLKRRGGHDRARQVWAAAGDVVSVRITYAEARGALAGARRGRHLTAASFTAAKQDWEKLWRQLTVIDADTHVVNRAGDLAEHERLRGYDAVHLAAALAGGCTLLVSSDAALCEGALNQGLAVIDLNDS